MGGWKIEHMEISLINFHTFINYSFFQSFQHRSSFPSSDFFLHSDMLFQFYDGQKWIQEEEMQFHSHEILEISKWGVGINAQDFGKKFKN